MDEALVPDGHRLMHCDECDREYIVLRKGADICPSCEIERGERKVRTQQNPEQ